MQVVPIHAAKGMLSHLLLRVEAGEEIVLVRGKKPVAKLVPFRRARGKRQFGTLEGVIQIGPEFFEPLPELSRWES